MPRYRYPVRPAGCDEERADRPGMVGKAAGMGGGGCIFCPRCAANKAAPLKFIRLIFSALQK